MATFLEQVNLLGHGGQQKKYDNQRSLNELYDTGAPSKLFRVESKNYGSDLFAQWQAPSHTRAASQTTFSHAGCLNIAQVCSLVTEEEGLHAMALLERYILSPLLPADPFSDPPAAFLVEEYPYVLLPDRSLKRDAHGLWLRDLLGLPTEVIVAGMQRLWRLFKGCHNCILQGSDEAEDLLRLIESHDFEASERLRYIDELA